MLHQIAEKMILTGLIKHLIALVEDERLHVTKRQLLVTNKGVQTSRRSDNNIGMRLLGRKDFNVLLHRSAAVEHCRLDIRKVFAEPGILVLNLIGQLSSVAHDKNGTLARNGLELVKSCQHKHSRLSKTGLGLAKYVDIQDRRRNANLLDCMWSE